LDR
jgi:hypothetical protein